jgi:hypothetical protein
LTENKNTVVIKISSSSGASSGFGALAPTIGLIGLKIKGSGVFVEGWNSSRKGLAHELGSKEVTVNTVSPGFTDTEMLADPNVRQTGAQMSPSKRLGIGHCGCGGIRGER